MKILNAILLLALAALISGCAGMTETQNRPEEQWNSAYIHAVEEAARREPRGMDVIWIRPPAARKDSEDSGSD